MAVVCCRHVWTIRDNPAVVKHMAINFISTAIVGAQVEWVAVMVHGSKWLERFWEAFSALPLVVHAGCLLVECSAGPMHHAPLHSLKEQWLLLRIRPISPDRSVNLSRCGQLVGVVEDNEHMHVR